MDRTIASVSRRETTEVFAVSMGWSKGVSGYIYHTVPVVLHAWLSHLCDFRAAVMAVIRCGGDADTTAAIVGGILGCAVGKEKIPAEWLGRLAEWPRTISWMERLGDELVSVREAGMVPAAHLAFLLCRYWPAIALHGCRPRPRLPATAATLLTWLLNLTVFKCSQCRPRVSAT